MRTGLSCLLMLCGVVAQAAAPPFTDDFPIKSCRFVPHGGNTYMPIKPGNQLYYSNAGCVAAGECDDLEEVWITIESEVRRIVLGSGSNRQIVHAAVLEERESENGELVEVSRNFVATCRPYRDVYYFGEEVDDYEDGEIVGHSGAWLAGRNGARPGILLADSPFLLGMRYYQEVAPGVALDRAEHVANNLEITVPAGTFKRCVKVRETNPLEPDSISIKVYCPGVGMVLDEELELTAIYSTGDQADDDDDEDDDD